jgi:hypothetical protein
LAEMEAEMDRVTEALENLCLETAR